MERYKRFKLLPSGWKPDVLITNTNIAIMLRMGDSNSDLFRDREIC